MAGDTSRTITIRFTANTKGLITGALVADKALSSISKKSNPLKDLAKSLKGVSDAGGKLATFARNLTLVEAGIQAAVIAGKYLAPMIGLLGLLPGVLAVAGTAFAVLKLGSAGIAAAFKGVGDAAQKSVADVFQKNLAPAAKSTTALLKAITPSLDGVALSMSKVAVATLKTVDSKDNIKSLNTVIGATKTAVDNVGGAFGPLVSALLAVLSIAAPVFAGLTAGATG
jgi:hypothetical protein